MTERSGANDGRGCRVYRQNEPCSCCKPGLLSQDTKKEKADAPHRVAHGRGRLPVSRVPADHPVEAGVMAVPIRVYACPEHGHPTRGPSTDHNEQIPRCPQVGCRRALDLREAILQPEADDAGF